MSEEKPRPKDATTVAEPETESESGYDSTTAAAMKFGDDADKEKDEKTILTPEALKPVDQVVSQPKSAEASAQDVELAILFQGVETQQDLKIRLQTIPAPDFEKSSVSVKPTADGTLGSSVLFEFPHASQIRGEFGVKTDFTKFPNQAPIFNGEKIQTITIKAPDSKYPDGSVIIQTEKGTVALTPSERRNFEFPSVFRFSDQDGNITTIAANGDKTIIQEDGSRITQFGPFDPAGRQFKRELNGDAGMSSVTYLQNGRRQLDWNPPREDGTASVVELPPGYGASFDAKFLTPPKEVPQKLADSIKTLSDATKNGDSKQVFQAIKTLAELELQSPEAKAALDQFAGSNSENLGIVRYARLNQDAGPIGVLLGTGALSSRERLDVIRAAVTDLSARAEKGPLSPEQCTLAARGMALTLHNRSSEKSSGTPTVAQQFEKLLEKQMTGEGRQAAMSAAFDMIELGKLPTVNRTGTADAFVKMFLTGAREAAADGRQWNTVSHQIEELDRLAKNGNRTALTATNAITDGGELYIPSTDDSSSPDASTEPKESFVSADLPGEDNKPAPEKIDTPAKAAKAVFGDDLNTLVSPEAIPDSGADYKSQDFHKKVAGMVAEFLKGEKPDQAFDDLRVEAGRPEWTGASSIAPSAFHKISVVKAVLDLEKAIQSGDKEKQKDAMRELAKLRTIKPGTDFAQVHKAIDEYLKLRPDQKEPGHIGRDQFNELRRRAEENLKESFKQSAGHFAGFLTAADDKQRQQALDAFQKSVNENPDSKLLEWSARLGDFGSALNLKQQLNAEKPDAKAIQDALEKLNKTSPDLEKNFYKDLLARLKEDPKTKDQFANVETLNLDSVKKLLQEGKLDTILPQLKKSMETGQMQDLFNELEALRKSKHSPVDLLKAGVHERPEDLEKAIEGTNDDIRDNQENMRRLERDFLKRGNTQDERDKIIEKLKIGSEQSRLMAGAISGPDVYRIEELNKVLGLKETQDPKKAADYLASLKESSDAGNPHAKALLLKLLPDELESIDRIIKALKGEGGADANAELKRLQQATKFIDEELNPMRVENLTWNFKTDKPPSEKDLAALEASLKVERDSGNQSANNWLDWCAAAKLVIPLRAGSGATKEGRIENIKQLGDLAKNGNDHARKALLAVAMDNANPKVRAYWSAEFNSHDGPKVLRPSLPDAVQSESYDYAAAAAKALTTVYDGKADLLDRGDALALSLALGRWSDFHVITRDIDDLLKKGMEGKNGDAVLSGVHDAININAAGGEQLARTILHGANLPEFSKYMPSFIRWAEGGDKVGMQVLAGLLAGRSNNADLLKSARETFVKISSDKRCQKPALEALMQAYELDVKQTDVRKNTFKGNPVLVETLGDVLGKTDRADIPDKVFKDAKTLFRDELEFFNKHPEQRNDPEQNNRYESVIRGFVASAPHFEKEDIGLVRATPQLAKALSDKNWQLPKALETDFKSRLLGELTYSPEDALACLANTGKIFTPEDVSLVMKFLPPKMPEATEMASMRFLMGMIGDKNTTQAVKDRALKEIEQHEWKSPQLDTDLRKALSDYIHGRVGDLKQLDRVIALVGNIGIEPPMALVVSRLGLPLDQTTISDVAEGLRNFDGDRAAYTKILQNAVILNALPKELNPFGSVDLKALVKRLADGPLTDSSEFAILTGDKVDKLLKTLEDLQYGLLQKEAAAGGTPKDRWQLQDAIFGSRMGGSTISGGFKDGAVHQSVENLQNVTRDGHKTSYWWLAAAGGGYLIKRFGPGGTEDKFAEKQKGALEQWKSAKEAAVTSTLTTSALVGGIVQLDTARKVGEYVNLLSTGQIIKSDELALTIAERTSSLGLQTTAPFIYDGLRGTAIDVNTGLPKKPGEIWERLRRNHATDLKSAPIFGQTFLGSSDALRFLQRPDLKKPELKTSDPYHFMTGKAHDLALTEAFKGVDGDPRFVKAVESYGKLIGTNSSMEMLFQMGMSGYKAEDFVKLARQFSKDMDSALRELADHKPNIEYLIANFKEASAKATDADAKRGLDARVKQLEEMLKLIPGTNNGKNDERYDITKEMMRLIESPDFNKESFLKFLKDNGPVLIWSTIAVAGILAMPFSGGLSGALTALAVAAIVATVSYVAVEGYKELVYRGGGSAYGSDFIGAVKELVTGDKYIQPNIRYDPKTGKFKAPPTMEQAFEKALEQIGKDTALNLIGAGFGKLLSVAAKGFMSPVTKVAATELVTDAKVIVQGLDKIAAKNLAASTYGGRFTKIFFESLPLGVFGATSGAIIQDELKTIKENRELVEFAGHAAAICLTVLFHRVGGHLMQPRVLRNGALEIPYDKTAFVDAMKAEYKKAGKPMPEMTVDGDVVKFKVGEKVMELRFVDPAKVAAELDAKGIQPKPLLPGEEVTKTGEQKPTGDPVEQKPGTQKPPVVPEEKLPTDKKTDGGDPSLPKKSEAPAPGPQPPNAAAVKSALEAVAKESTGDGKLSPTNKDAGKNAASNRQYLEKAINDGTLTPEQLNKLLTLDTFDLSSVLKMMSDGTISPKAMDKVMDWGKNHRELFLSNSAKQTKILSQAIERGLVDGPTMEAISLKTGVDKTNTMDVLAGLAAEPSATAATLGRVLQLASPELAHIRKAMIEGETISFNNVVKLSPKQLAAALSTDFSGAKLNKLITAMQHDGITADALKTLIECKSVEKVLDMTADQRRQVTSVISSYKLTPQGTDILIKRILNEPTGNPAVDAILKPEVIAKLLENPGISQGAHLNNLLTLAADHAKGTATRSIDALKKLMALDPSSSNSAMELIKNNKLTEPDLFKVLDELARETNANTQADRAASHANLSIKNPEFHKTLLSVEPPTLREGLVSSASRGHLTAEQLPKILEIRSSLPDVGKAFVDRILAEKANVNKIEVIESMQGKSFTTAELTQMSTALASGKMTLRDVRSLVELPPQIRGQVLELIKTKPATNVEELLSLAKGTDAEAFLSAMAKDHLQLNDAVKINEMASSKDKGEVLLGEQMRAILRAHKDTPVEKAKNPIEQAEIAAKQAQKFKGMLEDPNLASDAAMRVPEQFHTNPTTKLQAQEWKRVEDLKLEAGPVKDALTTFVREKLPGLHMGDRVLLDRNGMHSFEAADFGRIKAHFDWLVDGLSVKGTGKYPSPKELEWLASRFPESTILISALEAGVRTPQLNTDGTKKNPIPEEEFEVFLHGTDAGMAEGMLKNGQVLSETYVSKKKAAGEFYVTDSVRIARAYTKEASRGDKPGAVVAVALPKSVAKELRDKGFLKDGDKVIIKDGQIDLVRGDVSKLNGVAGTEKVFTKEALKIIKEKGFFFELKIPPEPAQTAPATPGTPPPGGKPGSEPGAKPGTDTGIKPPPVVEKPGTTHGAKLNTDTVGKPKTDAPAPKFDAKTFNADLEAARLEYVKDPTNAAAKARLTDLLQESINHQYRTHNIPVEFAPKVSIEPLKSGEHPTSDFHNETYKVRVGEGRLQTKDGTIHDPKHEGFHAILCLHRTAAYLHNRPAYMTKLTEAWAADLKAGNNIAGETPINRPTDQVARDKACDILQPVLKPYSKGVVTDVEARAMLDRTCATTDGAAQLKILADKMGVTPEQAKAYLHNELNNFFRLEKWHILPEAILKGDAKLTAYLKSIGGAQSNQLGRLIDPLVNTHRGLFDPDVYRFSSPEEHRARIHQYSEELKLLLETRGKGAKNSEDAQNLIATIQEQSRLWKLQDQLRKLESAKSPDDVKANLEQLQKLAELIKKDLPPEDPLYDYLSVFDNCAVPTTKPGAKPNSGTPPATPTGEKKP